MVITYKLISHIFLGTSWHIETVIAGYSLTAPLNLVGFYTWAPLKALTFLVPGSRLGERHDFSRLQTLICSQGFVGLQSVGGGQSWPVVVFYHSKNPSKVHDPIWRLYFQMSNWPKPASFCWIVLPILFWDYNMPIWGSLLTNQYFMECHSRVLITAQMGVEKIEKNHQPLSPKYASERPNKMGPLRKEDHPRTDVSS